ncbi:hypothetical protein [Cognatishimia activa]|uniref:Uncharacterized protein n=1 Tax=Cognatishimia activa TaxID=1715691 RepID=A0A0N7MBL3_9RHOB|nr:hypothetical protein [Cognatishimia activa]CUJ10074.1 hypothetical protein TA5113_02281 [Cognatishimia activa]CUK25728.1 hypothetical protein TA5114_01532 [Cognatishimia activa]
MTALNQYQRLEATGLWRNNTEEQRREVIAAIGDATLVISDMQDRPLTHWSIPAIKRSNPGVLPAVFHPAGDPSETLELPEHETAMVEAIEKLQKAIHRKEARPGRLRGVAVFASIAAIVAGAVFWLPDALRNHVTSVVPEINRVVLGQDMLSQMASVTGQACRDEIADGALGKLALRLDVNEIVVVPGGIRSTASLPGGVVLMSRAILEDHEDPAVAAGFVIAEKLRAEDADPLGRLLDDGGIWASFRLLTTGQLEEQTMQSFAEVLASEIPQPVATDRLTAAFAAFKVAASPYAYAIDISGETTIDLIEADALLDDKISIMSDGEWVALQEICNG